MNKIINIEDFTGSYEYRPTISYEMYGWNSHQKEYSTFQFELWFESETGYWVSASVLEKWKFDWTRFTSASKYLNFLQGEKILRLRKEEL